MKTAANDGIIGHSDTHLNSASIAAHKSESAEPRAREKPPKQAKPFEAVGKGARKIRRALSVEALYTKSLQWMFFKQAYSDYF